MEGEERNEEGKGWQKKKAEGGATTTPQHHPCTRGNWCCIPLVRLQQCCVGGRLYLVQHGDRAISVACRSGTHAVPVSIPGCTPVNARLYSVIRACHVRACVREMRGRERRKMSMRGRTRGRCNRSTIYAIARACMRACVQLKGGRVCVCERERGEWDGKILNNSRKG